MQKPEPLSRTHAAQQRCLSLCFLWTSCDSKDCLPPLCAACFTTLMVGDTCRMLDSHVSGTSLAFSIQQRCPSIVSVAGMGCHQKVWSSQACEEDRVMTIHAVGTVRNNSCTSPPMSLRSRAKLSLRSRIRLDGELALSSWCLSAVDVCQMLVSRFILGIFVNISSAATMSFSGYPVDLMPDLRGYLSRVLMSVQIFAQKRRTWSLSPASLSP